MLSQWLNFRQFQIVQISGDFLSRFSPTDFNHADDRRRSRCLQGYPLPLQAHRICGFSEVLRTPWCSRLTCNVFDPPAKGVHGRGGGGNQVIAGRALLCQPVVEQLLKRPGRFTELIEPDHAGTTFKGVKCPSQGCLVSQIGRVLSQRLRGNQPVLNNLPCFFKKDVNQLGLIV